MNVMKKNTIVATARSLFTRYGFGKTTIDDIARASRSAKSTIYVYFSSKEEVFQEVIALEGRMLIDEISKNIENVADPVEKLKLYAQTRMRLIRNLINLYAVINGKIGDEAAIIEQARKKSLEREILLITSILEEGMKQGTFEMENPKLTAFLIISAWKGLDFPWTDVLDLPDPDTIIDHLMNVLFEGICKH